MAKPKRASPKPGHGDNHADPASVLKALATEVLDQEEAAKVRERRKRNRKRAEASGVVLADLDRLYKMRDEPVSEVEAWFRRQWSTLGAFFTDLNQQFDLFAPRPAAPERRAAFKHAGKMAGLKGEDGTPPPNLPGDEVSQWMEGWHEGERARDAANADILTMALENAAAGQATDGKTGAPSGPADQPIKRGRGRPKKSGVAEKAAADFAADNPEVDTKALNGPDEEDDDDDDAFETPVSELAKQTGRATILVKTPSGEEVETIPSDPLVFEGVRYPTADAYVAARHGVSPTPRRSQSETAAERRAQAGVA